MESRGRDSDKRSRARPSINRRSCDQCRSRKVGCDRGSPCSNCVSARVSCTHSAVATSASTPKQRVLISAQYEQKIDDIANGIDGIKLLLERLNVSPHSTTLPDRPLSQTHQDTPSPSRTRQDVISVTGGETPWDHSAHVISLLKSVTGDRHGNSTTVDPEADQVVSSLTKMLRALETSSPARHSHVNENNITLGKQKPSMPSLEATLAILRWAKAREHHFRIGRIARVLPLEKFADICRKVYFTVDNYTEIDFILANGYLTYVFAERLIVSGIDEDREHWAMCRGNLHSALSKLPLLLPASMDTIAALTVAAYDAMENSRATVAWTFVSSAANLCQTLGYHRSRPGRRGQGRHLQDDQESLFWSVYNLDKGLSLQLDRPPNIRDADITLPVNPERQSRATRLARIQAKAYDELYNPAGLARPDDKRARDAEILANQLRGLLQEAHADMETATSQPDDDQADPLRLLYLQCSLVCHSSLLTLILRAIPADSPSGASDECVAVARLTLEIHQQCMASIRSCKTDPQILNKYISWAILNIPFVPFSVLFMHAVKTGDIASLTPLDLFATSLQPEQDCAEGTTHPFRLYQLLCKAARLHIDSASGLVMRDPIHGRSVSSGLFDLGQVVGMEIGTSGNPPPDGDDESQLFDLSDWYHGNQQLMRLLEDEPMY